MTRIVVITLLALTNAGLQAAEYSDEKSIRTLRAESNAFIVAHDATGIASLLDPEYQITTGKGDHFQEDPEESVRTWQEVLDRFSDVLYVRTPESIEVGTYYPLASERGSWIGTWTTADGPVEIGGRYSASWRKTEGKWRIHAELFVTLFCKGSGC